MLVVGLTGGIGSGKSTVEKLFAKKHIPVIDADLIAKNLTTTNSKIYYQLVNHFSKNILLKNGSLNRAKLRKIIFADPKERIWLENLLHPLIRDEMRKYLKQIPPTNPYCLMVIPLLTESEPFPFLDRILVIDLTMANQIKRLQKRDKLTKKEALAIIKVQAKRRHRLEKADDVIINDGIMANLSQQVEELHQRYLKLSHEKKKV